MRINDIWPTNCSAGEPSTWRKLRRLYKLSLVNKSSSKRRKPLTPEPLCRRKPQILINPRKYIVVNNGHPSKGFYKNYTIQNWRRRFHHVRGRSCIMRYALCKIPTKGLYFKLAREYDKSYTIVLLCRNSKTVRFARKIP